VIVVLRDQLTATPPTKTHIGARKAAADSDQSAVLTRLSKHGGPKAAKVTHYSAANAFSATVNASQAADLASDPSVAEVIPNTRISIPAAPSAAVTPAAGPVAPVPANVCPTDPSKPLLEPEALSDTHTASDDPAAKTAQQLVTGKGVSVAYIADAIDPNSPDFIRADGSHVITDYKAFSADGPTTVDGGAEAFGDASSIAAQGLVSHDLSTFVNPAYPLPAGCNIRILGMSPGASIVALKTDFYTSSIIQAIDYAVTVDHVNVLNESFGGSVLPDSSARNAIEAFNDMAVAAGTTVTVSSGDAGTTGTIGNPATDPNVISVAASTNNRGYAQTGYAGARTFGNGTWVNDQISSLSSGGFTQGGSTVDLAAPGEAGWAVCEKSSAECTNYAGGTSDFQLFGGTSESAPLTAGAAALVIQAYRQTHGGTSPTPALVKTLLTSTATDLGLPTFEQGAGLLNSRAAVEAALTYPGATSAAPAGVSSNIALSTSQVSISGAPGSKHTTTIGVRNVGTKPLTVATSTRDFTPFAQQKQTVTLNPSTDPKFPYPTTGAPWSYKKLTFTVPPGTDRLTAAMIWQGTARPVNGTEVTPVVRLSVFDPSGAFVSNSRPQGAAVSANYANLDLRQPKPGTYTAVLYTLADGTGFSGPVSLQTTSEQAIRVGTVSPSTLTLAPGQSKNVKVALTTPSAGGDTSQAITVASSDGHQTAIPVVLRSVVPTDSGSGSFAGAITGGNGRAGSAEQTFTYAFNVPAGKKSLDVGVKLGANPSDLLEGVLIDPNDEAQSIGTNSYTDTSTPQGLTMQLDTAKPIAGQWRLVILVQSPVSGNVFAQPFTGTIKFDQSLITTSGLPTLTSTKRAKGVPVMAHLKVKNTGIAPISVQVDPRSTTKSDIPLTSPFGSQTVSLPEHDAPNFIIPPGTTSVTAAASSSLPAIVELTPFQQGIDVPGDLTQAQNGSTVSVANVSETRGTVSTGLWFTDVNEIGPFGPDGAPSGTTTVDVNAHTPGFATDVTSSTGDFYAAATDPTADIGTPLTIQPGKTGTITLLVNPTAKKGTKVNGVLNVITPPNLSLAFATTGDVLAQVPYSYTVS
jgi:hypothetical protein